LTSFPDLAQLAWSPEASELAFESSFQDGCSAYGEDIYQDAFPRGFAADGKTISKSA
jgi:hypothetical protein